MHTVRRRFGAASRALSTPGGAQCVANMRGACGCGSSSHVVGVPGGAANACPAFIPRDLVTSIQANRMAFDTLATVCEVVGASLTSSFVLAPVGAPLGAAGAALIAIGNGCNVDVGLLQGQARVAAAACTVGSLVAGIAAAAFTVTVVGSPVGATLAAISGALSVAAPVLAAIGEGRAPRFSDVAALTDTVGRLSNTDTSSIRMAAGALDDMLPTFERNRAVQAALSQIPSAKERLKEAKAAEAANAASSTSSGSADKDALRSAKAGGVANKHNLKAAMNDGANKLALKNAKAGSDAPTKLGHVAGAWSTGAKVGAAVAGSTAVAFVGWLVFRKKRRAA